MPVFISEKHLIASDKRMTYIDCTKKGQKGFALRTTPNGVFTFYYQHLNKKTGKRDWHLIGSPPKWTPESARAKATLLAGQVADGKSIKTERQIEQAQARAQSTSFRQLHDEYIDYCKQPVTRRWGLVPRKETWQQIAYAMKRPLEWWQKRAASEITPADIKELYTSFVQEGHPAQANNVRGRLQTMFVWAMHEDRQYLSVNPCTKQLEDDKAVERADIEDGRVLTADELRTFWFGLDRPDCPGERLSRLALKLSLVTLLRTGECVKIEREKIGPSSVTLPLNIVKGRRSKKARDVVQPLNSLAREIVGEVFSIGDPNRKYAFPSSSHQRKGSHISQQSLGRMMSRTSNDATGQMGLCEYLCLDGVTPHDLRRTGACILEQLGYSDAAIGKVMTHKTADKDAAPVTRERYLVPVLDDLDAALREILGLAHPNALPATPKQLVA